jgi:hypothetical protein
MAGIFVWSEIDETPGGLVAQVKDVISKLGHKVVPGQEDANLILYVGPARMPSVVTLSIAVDHGTIPLLLICTSEGYIPLSEKGNEGKLVIVRASQQPDVAAEVERLLQNY